MSSFDALRGVTEKDVGYPGSGFAYFPLGFSHKGDQNRIKKDQDRTRRALSNALFTFPLKPPLPNPRKIQNTIKITKKRYTFSKSHHDSPIEGTKNLKSISTDRTRRALSNGVIFTQIPCLHIPQNCEIPPKSQIFSKTPPRFAH